MSAHAAVRSSAHADGPRLSSAKRRAPNCRIWRDASVYYRQPLIQVVRTGYLSYFQGHDLNHFNFAYGSQRSTTTKKINVGEVWDPVKIYGSSSYNPYGHRLPPLQETFDANDKSGPFGGGARLIV